MARNDLMRAAARFGFALCVLALGAIFLVHRFLVVYPADSNESLFLKRYNPETSLERFATACRGMDVHASTQSRASVGRVSRRVTVRLAICATPKDYAEVMNRVHADAARGLASSGAQLLSDEGGPEGGFTIRYAAGRSSGTIRAERPRAIDASRSSVSIQIDERWATRIFSWLSNAVA